MKSENFYTIPYDSKYFPQIIELWNDQYDNEYINFRKELFEWLCLDNPFLGNCNPYFLLMENDQVVGMHGFMPLQFSNFGKNIQGYFAHDILLSKNYRGKGLGKIILREMVERSDFFAGALWFNEPNYGLYKKCGWLDIPHLQSFVKIFNFSVFLESRIKIKSLRNTISKILSKVSQIKHMLSVAKPTDNIKIVEIDKFDSVIDVFFDYVSPFYGIMVTRNSQYLNWKFVKKPFNNYKKIVAFNKTGELCGYMVSKLESSRDVNRGRIMDFLVNPNTPEVFSALLEHCCNELKQQNVDYIQLTTSSDLIVGLVKKSGFVGARKPVRFMVIKWENNFKSDFVGDRKNWYITESDGDGDAWTVDNKTLPNIVKDKITMEIPDKQFGTQKCDKIRIAFILWSLEGMGGSEHVVFDIVRKLNKELFEILVVSFREGMVRNAYEKLGVKVAVVTKQSKLHWQFILSFKALLIKNNIQLVNAHHFSPLLYSYLATRRTGIKIVYTEHSVWQYREMGIIRKLISNLLLIKSNAIIAISEQLLQFYQSLPLLCKGKIHLILNGIDLARFNQNHKRYVLKSTMGFKPNDIVIGMIANLRPEKNHKVLISAFSKLHEKIENSHLVLAGLDCMNGDVQRCAADTGCADKIHFLGSIENVADVLNILDVFCLPSFHEGMPLTVLEAMACGVPVVGSDVLGINEVITHNDNGLLFTSNDPTMLAETLTRLIGDNLLQSRLRQAGLEYVKKNYSLDDKIKDYEDLFLCV